VVSSTHGCFTSGGNSPHRDHLGGPQSFCGRFEEGVTPGFLPGDSGDGLSLSEEAPWEGPRVGGEPLHWGPCVGNVVLRRRPLSTFVVNVRL
jgi:hypothetical protein